MTLLVGLLAFHTLVAWVPFEPDPPRRVDNAASLREGTLTVDGRRAVARSPEGQPGVGPDNGRAEVVLTVTPAREDQRGPARIASIAASDRRANLMIGQERADLIVRVRRPGTNAQGRPALVVEDAFEAGRPTDIRVRATAEGVRVDVDGATAAAAEESGGVLGSWEPSQRLWLGDDPRVPRTWHGTISEAVVTVDGARVDYLDDGALEVPERTWYVPERIVGLARVPDAAAGARSLLHLLGFVPVGILLALLQGHRATLARSAAFAACWSVVLQLGKTSIAGRHPSLLDVAAHLTGALLGSWLVLRRSSATRPRRRATGASEAA